MNYTNCEYISSRSNPLIVEYSKLSDKKYRDASGLFFFEGVKLFREAVSKGICPVSVICTEKNSFLLNEIPNEWKTRKITVTDAVYDKITNENSPQGVFCTVKYLDNLHKFDTIYSRQILGKVFCASGVRDPGNLGTIMRSAVAFGIDTLILSSDCADIYNPKTIRASMGSVFSLKIVRASDMLFTVHSLRECGYRTLSAALDRDALPLSQIEIDSSVAFIVGNEGQGLSGDIISASDSTVFIPMSESCESLNVAIASSLLMWELSKHK